MGDFSGREPFPHCEGEEDRPHHGTGGCDRMNVWMMGLLEKILVEEEADEFCLRTTAEGMLGMVRREIGCRGDSKRDRAVVPPAPTLSDVRTDPTLPSRCIPSHPPFSPSAENEYDASFSEEPAHHRPSATDDGFVVGSFAEAFGRRSEPIVAAPVSVPKILSSPDESENDFRPQFLSQETVPLHAFLHPPDSDVPLVPPDPSHQQSAGSPPSQPKLSKSPLTPERLENPDPLPDEDLRPATVQQQVAHGAAFPEITPLRELLPMDRQMDSACEEVNFRRSSTVLRRLGEVGDPLRRRSSFDAHEVRRKFQHQVIRRGLRLRRRNTENESTLIDAADEISQLATMKKAIGKDNTCQVVLKRVSTLLQGELDRVQSPFSLIAEPYRKFHRGSERRIHVLNRFSKLNIFESWPSSATALLTGGQTVQERLFLFWHIELLISQNLKAAKKAASSFMTQSTIDSPSNNTETERRVGAAPAYLESTPSKELQRVRRLRLAERLAYKERLDSVVTGSLMPVDGALATVRPKAETGLQILSGCHCISHPEKPKGGEDAHFAVDGESGIFGVADGVGQWAEYGCDAGLFSRRLAQGCFAAAKKMISAGGQFSSKNQQPCPKGKRHLSDSSSKRSRKARPAKAYAMAVAGRASTALRQHATDSRQSGCGVYCFRNSDVPEGVHRPYDDKLPSRDALHILRKGLEATEGVWGACTALVAKLDGDRGKLGVANLGDSAMIVLRRDMASGRLFTVVRRTKEQQHCFNCPYQLSKVPAPSDYDFLEKQGWTTLKSLLIKKRESESSAGLEGDSPDQSDQYNVQVQEGDLILSGTDGVFDNLFDHEIGHLVSLCISPYEAEILASSEALCDATSGFIPHPRFVGPPTSDKIFGVATPPKHIAQALSEAAYFRSLDPTASTPFGKNSKRARYANTGGKMDDISVVACWVVRQPARPELPSSDLPKELAAEVLAAALGDDHSSTTTNMCSSGEEGSWFGGDSADGDADDLPLPSDAFAPEGACCSASPSGLK